MKNEELKMKSSGKNFLKDKSFIFSIDIINLYKKLVQNKEFVLSKQMLRSGTATGALIREAELAQSKPDFISKLSISLKEANETRYWLELLHHTDYIGKDDFDKYVTQNDALIGMLVASIKTSKSTLNK